MGILEARFEPKEVRLKLPCRAAVIDAVNDELSNKAEQDDDKCWGYFPALAGNNGIDSRLPFSQAYAQKVPNLVIRGRRLNFNFLRLSLIPQSSEAPYHLDSDAATAVTGDTANMKERFIWRLLLNMSEEHKRTLSYLDVNPYDVELSATSGYTNCPPEYAKPDVIRSVILGIREQSEVSGVLFCSNRVLHAGQDNENGHFVAGYGYEELREAEF